MDITPIPFLCSNGLYSAPNAPSYNSLEGRIFNTYFNEIYSPTNGTPPFIALKGIYCIRSSYSLPEGTFTYDMPCAFLYIPLPLDSSYNTNALLGPGGGVEGKGKGNFKGNMYGRGLKLGGCSFDTEEIFSLFCIELLMY